MHRLSRPGGGNRYQHVEDEPHRWLGEEIRDRAAPPACPEGVEERLDVTRREPGA